MALKSPMRYLRAVRYHWRLRQLETRVRLLSGEGQAEARRLMTGLSYYSGLLEVRRRWQLRGRPGIVILMYHNVGETRFKNPLNCVSEKNFERHLRYLMRRYHVLSLEQAVELLEQGDAPPQGAVVVSFDDGYRDNYEVAFPLLRKYGCQATIFVATEPLDTGKALWQSKLFCWLVTTRKLSLQLAAGEPPLRLENPRQRLSAYWAINFRLRRLDTRGREAHLLKIGEQLGFAGEGDPPDVVPMLTWAQLVEMSDAGIEVGSHTVTHPVLTSLTPEEARRQLVGSKLALEGRLKRPVTLFAYPFGQEEHFDERTQALVAEAGYRAACSALDGLNVAGTDRFALRRMYVPNLPVATFARKLLECFRGQPAG